MKKMNDGTPTLRYLEFSVTDVVRTSGNTPMSVLDKDVLCGDLYGDEAWK